jgi:GNAT superfamily N-acetyltransferase
VLQRCCWVQEAVANDTLDIAALHESIDDVRRWIAEWETWCLRLSGDGQHDSQSRRLVGAVRARSEHERWEIGRLMVAPDQAGRGIGRWLLSFIESRAPEAATHFSLFTGSRSSRNIAIYELAGYELQTGTPAPPGTAHLTKRR